MSFRKVALVSDLTTAIRKRHKPYLIQRSIYSLIEKTLSHIRQCNMKYITSSLKGACANNFWLPPGRFPSQGAHQFEHRGILGRSVITLKTFLGYTSPFRHIYCKPESCNKRCRLQHKTHQYCLWSQERMRSFLIKISLKSKGAS